ncbi:MAG: ABC transporter ATP-binding protein [Lachnospiraceae bacterium]|nr:ABC transporter ATP-binding protein [Lachnospiraceae bacterium]
MLPENAPERNTDINAAEMRDVVFRYFEKGKRNILDHTDLTVRKGSITVLMGSSGCGKSTLAAVLAGLYPENGGYIESGTIRLFGEDVSSLPIGKRASFVGFVFQNPDLQFCMNTLRSELIFCLENSRVPAPEIDGRLLSAAEALGTEDLLDRSLFTLSGGEKQKAMLTCIYALGSRMLILDEAFANLDRKNALELLSLLIRLRDEGRTILAIDHQIDLWKNAADEFIVLGEGARVLARGITRSNLDDFREIFDREGLFELRERHRKSIRGEASCGTDSTAATQNRVSNSADGTEAVRFEDLTVPAFAGSSRNLLENASAVFKKGTLNAILGESGSGKTTTFLSLLKQHPFSGTILLNGKTTGKMKKKELYRQIGIVFQNPANQFITQNVLEEVTEGIRIWHPRLSEEAVRKEAEELLERYGLSGKTRYSPYMLSQGQQRRLAVLSVLSGGQQILLLDEPTYGQDYRSTAAIMEHLAAKVREEGLTVIFITHDRTLAGVYADKVYELRSRKLAETDPEDLLKENGNTSACGGVR